MHRYMAGTPCPAPHPSFSTISYDNYAQRASVYAPSCAADDTTANLEYTTVLQAHQRHAKPRRPTQAIKRPTFNPSMDIFEDVAMEEQRQAEMETKRRSHHASVMPQGARSKRSIILANPAQRIPKPAPAVQDPQNLRPHRRRVSQVLGERQGGNINATMQLQEDMLERKELKKQGPKKDPRRRTIYVPSDDTTIVTIHPGQSAHPIRNPREASPDLGLDLVTLSEEDGDLVPALKKKKAAPRKSLAAPPKRGPLMSTTRSLQSVSFCSDIKGSGDGKENVPPGISVASSKVHGTHIEVNFVKPAAKSVVSKAPRARSATSHILESTSQPRTNLVNSQKRLRSQVSQDMSPVKVRKSRADCSASTVSSKTSSSKASTVKFAKPRVSRPPVASTSPFHTEKSPPDALRRKRVERGSTEISMMHIVGRPQSQPQRHQEKYPVLTEDLARPELYEDNWLSYQEVAITQLLNSIFDSARQSGSELSLDELRKKLLALYHDPTTPMLHKRLQASLQYGALGIPKDLLAQTLRLRDDVGLRKKFLNLWTRSYDLQVLRAAVETIVGRQIPTPCRLSTGSTSSDDGSRTFRAERRAIESFLDTFLIKNEDAVRMKVGAGSIATLARGEDDFGSQAWGWRRTALRSLMLILLLDQAKTTKVFTGCLFQSTSPYKTSVEILHQLSNMLLPSLGDITRPLNHLSFKVEHVQYPLEELAYQIENIAVDLRDGITLTRLVELLLYPRSVLQARHDDTVTVTMPTGDALISSWNDSHCESWVISQHLKHPAVGRPQKVYNVQVALAALNTAENFPSDLISNITADDIVDGHREKTLSLLWLLVGKCGLANLVDWPSIVKETERFQEQWYRSRDNFEERYLDSDFDDRMVELDGMEYHKRILLSWARSIARLHGLRVANLTTSFADPMVLEVIVDTYLPTSISTSVCDGAMRLPAKLKAVGCSSAFISLFTARHTTARSIPSKDFTLLTLSFLASRLLPLNLTHRAATTIQRAFRLHLRKQHTHKRIALLKLAHASAKVAKQRQLLVEAATVVQRRWRAILQARKAQLESDVQAFQALARAWAIRRWVRRITAGRIGGKEKKRRAMGGW